MPKSSFLIIEPQQTYILLESLWSHLNRLYAMQKKYLQGANISAVDFRISPNRNFLSHLKNRPIYGLPVVHPPVIISNPIHFSSLVSVLPKVLYTPPYTLGVGRTKRVTFTTNFADISGTLTIMQKSWLVSYLQFDMKTLNDFFSKLSFSLRAYSLPFCATLWKNNRISISRNHFQGTNSRGSTFP